MIRFFSFWLLAGVLEYPFPQFFFGKSPFILDQYPLGSFVLHCFSVFLLFWAFPKGNGRPLFLFFPALFPLFGWLAFLGFYFLQRTHDGVAAVSEAISPSFLQKGKIRSMQALPRQERIFKELDVMPLADILAGIDLDLKRGAIERLAQLKTPEAIDILLECRSDPSSEIRFFATSALTKIKREFDEAIEAARRHMKKDIYKISSRIFLAKVYLQYSRSHLLDVATAQAYEKEALYHLDYCIRTEEKSCEAFEMLIDIYMVHQEWDVALSVLELFERSKKGKLEEIEKIRTQIYYNTGRYPEMLRELSKMRQRGGVDPQWNYLAAYWGLA